MDFSCLGNSGLKVSRLCLGCMSYGSSKARPWILDEEAALPFYQQAIEAGINFFDTADLYSQGMSEEITGRALKKLGAQREQVVIATKVFYPNRNQSERAGHVEETRQACDRCEPSASRPRLHRSLPNPSIRPFNTDGRNAGGAN
jgi:1-deoxyxylulose-5-phosphate synthase